MRKWSAVALVALFSGPAVAAPLTGPAAYGDWRTDAPGVVRKITPDDLPPPRSAPQRRAAGGGGAAGRAPS